VHVRLSATALRVDVGDDPSQTLELPAVLARRGTELKLVLPAEQEPTPDAVLLKLLAHACAAQQVVLSGMSDPLVSHYSERHLSQLLRVSWLAPDILAAIAQGRHPPTLTGRRLLRAANVPLDWGKQRRFFGFC